jgi:hypothetical protein
VVDPLLLVLEDVVTVVDPLLLVLEDVEEVYAKVELAM